MDNSTHKVCQSPDHDLQGGVCLQRIKQRLLQYAGTTLLFGQKEVNPHLVSFNRTILLHGPPGSGKTSLSKAIAQKLAIRFQSR